MTSVDDLHRARPDAGEALLVPRLPIPAPVVFAAVGIGLGSAWHRVPALPAIRMPPDLVLLIFLRPLLTPSACALPLRAFRLNAGLRACAQTGNSAYGVPFMEEASIAHSALLPKKVCGTPPAQAFE